MLLKLIPVHTAIPFARGRHIGAILSAVLVMASIGLLLTRGLNFGVDFRGGITIEVADDQPIDIAAARSTVNALGLGEAKIQEIRDFAGGEDALVIVIERQDAPADAVEDNAAEIAQQAASGKVQTALRALLGDGIDFRKIEVVGPTVSGELVRAGVMAVVIAVMLMLAYIWFRFEWQFGVAAIVTLVHDITITLGMLSLTQLDFSVSLIAALLTIVGYSVNDTVIVFDRIRENLRKFKQKPFMELIDLSINETLSRTIMTSGTTLLALAALVVFGGEVLRGFTSAIVFGIFIGTYSSIFIAAPFLIATGVKRDWSKQPIPATP